MHAVEEGDIEIIEMWEEGDGDQDVTFVKFCCVLYIFGLHLSNNE